MDQARFQQAQELYDAGDYRQAAKAFLAAAGRGAEGNGAAYHMAGNSLMRLRRYTDAIQVYRHALRDETYGHRGAVRVNLGQAQAALGEYPDAVASFDEALGEADYVTPYKALQAKANALLEMGRMQEAAAAYRQAALDPVNPNPGKALNNLGLCFMALGRAQDASEAYKAALGFDAYEGRGRTLSNLGQAFVSMEDYADAIKAFERATELHGYTLGPAAAADYERALAHRGPAEPAAPTAAVATPSLEPTTPAEKPAEPSVTPHPEPDGESSAPAVAVAAPIVAETATAPAEVSAGETYERVEGWQTGEMRPPSPTIPTEQFQAVDTHGWSADELRGMEGVDTAGVVAGTAAGLPASGAAADVAGTAADELGIGDEQAVDAFFSMTEDEMKQRSKAERRAERAGQRSERSPLTAVFLAIAAVVVVAILIGAAWFLGLGWPTQSQTVGGMMQAHSEGTSVDAYWVAVPDTDVAKEMAKIPAISKFVINDVERGSQDSTVLVTVTPVKGAELRYRVTLAREGVGWKVTGVDNDWSSVGGP